MAWEKVGGFGWHRDGSFFGYVGPTMPQEDAERLERERETTAEREARWRATLPDQP